MLSLRPILIYEQIANNYERVVFNGGIGRIVSIDEEAPYLVMGR